MEQLPCLKRLEVWKWSILALQVKLWKGLNLHFACKMEPGVPLLQHVQVSLVHFSQHCSVATHLYCVVYLWCLHFFKLIYFLSPGVPLPNVTARRTIWNGGGFPLCHTIPFAVSSGWTKMIEASLFHACLRPCSCKLKSAVAQLHSWRIMWLTIACAIL